MSAPDRIAALNAAADRVVRLAPEVGGLCRCVACCCRPEVGHNHPAWIAYEAEERALERYRDARASGLSDHEAREEGWPSAPEPA